MVLLCGLSKIGRMNKFLFVIENGHIKSFSYETKSGENVSYVFTNVGKTVVKCPEC